MYAYFNRFEFTLTLEQAESGSHPGPCDRDIAELLKVPEIAAQFEKIDPAAIAQELQEYGAWDEVELQDHGANRARILWIACGDIAEEARLSH